MLDSSRYYPPIGFHFMVRLADPMGLASMMASMAGLTADVDGAFQEVQGMDVEMEMTEIKEGGENRFYHKVPKGIKYSNLKLKRGLVTSTSAFGEWCLDAFSFDFSSKLELKHVMVLLLNEQSLPVMVWTFFNAYPVRWKLTEGFNAKESQIVVEEIELSYQRFDRTSVDNPIAQAGMGLAKKAISAGSNQVKKAVGAALEKVGLKDKKK